MPIIEEEVNTGYDREPAIAMPGQPYLNLTEEGSDVNSIREENEALDELLHTSEGLLRRESTTLLNEIERLEMTRRMLDKRLGNVMALVGGFPMLFYALGSCSLCLSKAFSSVNIEDSKRMQKLTEAAVRDSAGIYNLRIQDPIVDCNDYSDETDILSYNVLPSGDICCGDIWHECHGYKSQSQRRA